MRAWLAIAAVVLAAGWGCSAPFQDLTVREEMRRAERFMEWGLVYFNSWLRDRDPRYLNLAREHTERAVGTYFYMQIDLGHSYPDFYVMDKRRRRGCRFLREIDTAALRNRVTLSSSEREGCLK